MEIIQLRLFFESAAVRARNSQKSPERLIDFGHCSSLGRQWGGLGDYTPLASGTFLYGRCRCGDGLDLQLNELLALRQSPSTPVAPVKAPAASPSRRWKKNFRQGLPVPVAPVKPPAASPLHRWEISPLCYHDLALLRVLELQVTALVKVYPHVNRDVRVLPFLLDTQSSL
jgi:hypothetical protein